MEKVNSFVFFSNQLETLSRHLYERLFSLSSPFEKRMVIVPDSRVKDYLYHYFSLQTKEKITFGIEVMSLSKAIQELTRDSKKQHSFYLPSRSDLCIKIEERIVHYQRLSNRDIELTPLFDYLGGTQNTCDRHVRKKIIALSEQLSHFFNFLAEQNERVIADWLNEAGWQQKIWRDIFFDGAIWSYPQKALHKASPKCRSIHLFGFSFISAIYLDFFHRLSGSFYVLSPSEYFWEDVYTDKERLFLQKILEGKNTRLKVQQQMDFYLRETNPLVGNFGKMGREFVKSLGKKEPYLIEDYVSSPCDTILGNMQNDFLYLGQEQNICYQSSDHSIQLHACTSRLREVEILYDNLLYLLSTSKNTLKDVIVLAPNLETYIPFIHQIFSKSYLDYKIMDYPMANKNDHLEVWMHFLSLADKRLEKEVVLQLFFFPSFYKKREWTFEEVKMIAKWIDKMSIRWGLDKEHRETIFQRSIKNIDRTSWNGSWLQGLERLMTGLIISDESEWVEGLSYLPTPEYALEWSDSELFGDVIAIINQLHNDLSFLQSYEGPFDQWLVHLEKMKEQYFIFDVEDQFISECKKITERLEGLETPFSIESIIRVLRTLNSQSKGSFQASHLEAITFSSLKTGRVLPAKIIYLLGMEEESFPRREKIGSVCDVKAIKNRLYYPSKEEEDRYLFLEALLAARQYFVISYCRISEKDQKPQNASSLVDELFAYLENRSALLTRKNFETIHPSLSFDKSYFSNEITRPMLSLHLQTFAKMYFSKEKTKSSFFLPELYGKKTISIEAKSEEEVTIHQLSRFAKHPIKFFMQDTLGIYLPSLFQADDPEFTLAGYEKAELRAMGIKKPVEYVLQRVKHSGYFPVGVFEEIALAKVTEELSNVNDHLRSFGIQKADLFSIHLSLACRQASFHDGAWSIPAITLKSKNGQNFIVEGTIENVCPSGFVVHGENQIKDLISIWPLYLVILSVADRISLLDRKIFLTKKGEIVDFDCFHALDLLADYLDFFQGCKNRASFLMPSWSEAILDKNENDFEKKMKRKDFLDVSPFPDEYLRWIFLKDPTPSIDGLHAFEKILPEDVFKPLLSRRSLS
jgi:exodeoxyribonuclease V gamma subunit